ncbi:MAG: 1-deoxy-D-xylulose-5-phosphate synthase [Epsilonproteobacteria bacterium]|nr:1-deoxy-D-xylulose-5-phosphate synthase [Campylobacterota bacterium]
MNIKEKSIDELNALCTDIRKKILETVSQNGGHLSSTLGVVELIVAMHYVFDAENDPFIYDVSHQAYAHKLLTDRWEKFDTLRQFGGISGYTKPSESPYDYFVAGHSSTSISLAVGAAKAIKLKGEDRLPIAMIGDGSMTAGMVYEAMNELGHAKYPCVIILNDNEMSIAKPIGAISNYLSQVMAGRIYQKIKTKTAHVLEHFPEGATYMAKKFEESFKLITPGILFEELGLEYIGPTNGHDIEALIESFTIAKEMKKPVILHAQTIKGKGYGIAEGSFEHWHGVSPFELESGKAKKKSGTKNATTMFGESLLALAQEKEDVVGVTAAMPSGTGIKILMETLPERFWDVAIAEQHAVTSMCAMAKEGFKPYIAIYSTFLQRAYDQVIHDACIIGLPVVFAIDRAGIVGEDGETHQGAFDISYLRAIPNMTLFAPRDEASMQYAIEFAYEMQTPCAFRYPRGAFLPAPYESKPFTLGKAQLLKGGESDILLIGYGNGVGRACETAAQLDQDVAILDLIFVKPLDEQTLRRLSKKYTKWYIFSDSAKMGGVASAIQELGIEGVTITSFEYEDHFITHGNTQKVEASMGLLPEQLANKIG